MSISNKCVLLFYFTQTSVFTHATIKHCLVLSAISSPLILWWLMKGLWSTDERSCEPCCYEVFSHIVNMTNYMINKTLYWCLCCYFFAMICAHCSETLTPDASIWPQDMFSCSRFHWRLRSSCLCIAAFAALQLTAGCRCSGPVQTPDCSSAPGLYYTWARRLVNSPPGTVSKSLSRYKCFFKKNCYAYNPANIYDTQYMAKSLHK